MCYVPGTETAAATLAGLTFSEWGTVSMVGSTLLTGVSMVQNAQAQAAQADYNEEIAQRNQAQAETEAKYNEQVLRNKQLHERRVETEKFRRTQAQRRVAFAKSGSAGSGSALEVLAGALATHERNIINLDYSYDLEAQRILYGGATASSAYGSQAEMYGMQGDQALAAAPWSAGATLLSGGANAYDYYTRGKKKSGAT
ncbi:MAG: hypothetical protein PHV85_00505 [Desulfovibrionaceae bacterium]|nr:hypothetical protein [Desulfovibrionaceae bacterium]